MARRDDGTASAIILGGLALGVGLLAIDHYYSRKGTSALDRLTGGLSRFGTHMTGADPWASELGKLSKPVRTYAEAVIDKVIATETDPSVLSSLSQALSNAGMTQTAAAVQAKAHT